LEKKKFVGIVLTLVLLVMLYNASNVRLVAGWSNGGYSSDPEHPLYGTHDWIAEHALDWLPLEEKQYIQNNLVAYLYGTEMPDNPEAIGDTVNHHIYFWSNGSLQDDASAVRAREEYINALDFLRSGDFLNAAKTAGIMSHYIVDVTAFGHVMGAGTDWGPEVHHSDYESYVNERTNSYEDVFNEYLVFDDELRTITAYDAALELAYDTTFGHGEGGLGCVWMDENYNWNNTVFKNRCGESLNLAVNYLADVLHTLYVASLSTRYPWPMFHHNLEHTGFTESPAPNTNHLLWTYTTGSRVFSSPAVADGKVYVGSEDYNVYCLDASNGAYIWSYATGGPVYYSSPAVADGKVYVGSEDGNVYCLDALAGEYIWSTLIGGGDGGVSSSPAVADGVVFIGSFDGNVYAFGDVIRYPEDGHPTLQDAINAASPGATISVALGTYHESIVINKPLTILGRKGSSPVFDGGGSGTYATLLPGASGSIIAGIVITNWDQGILIVDASSCKICDNIMSLNDHNGIALKGNNAVNNLIYNNIFQENTIAINITQSSTDNIIYHNSFLNNPTQVYISPPTANIWDDGYPSGGNYWSTLPSKDLYRGPNQNEPGSDGINDTRCTIAANNIDRYPLVKPYAGPHDIGITNVFTSKTVIGQGYTLQIELKILNYGLYGETFTVAAYADALTIAIQPIILASRNSILIIFTWSTIGVVKGNYTISLIVDTVPDEAYTADNMIIDGWVVVSVIGDINGDFKVDIKDLVLVIKHYGSYPGSVKPWNPNADVNCDNKVDIKDLVLVIKHYGEHYP
jgi:parallel beta-helix repeat protein